MGLVKRTYVDGETVITADNLNDIQDEIIQNASDISTKGTYSKPAGGIPATDLASAVQTSLGKADTALQSSDIDNTLTVSGKAADAKKTGDEISDVKNTLTQLETTTAQLDQNMAYVESGNTASRPYIKGEFISWKGTLYTVSPDNGISSGVSFSTGAGGNLALVGAPGGLNRVRCTPGPEITVGSVEYRDCGAFVWIRVNDYSATIAPWARVVVGTIPISTVGSFVSASAQGFQNTLDHVYSRGSLVVNGTTGEIAFQAYEDTLTAAVPFSRTFFLPKT